MTNDEKAKAYDEALAKCKAYMEDTKKRWSEEFCKATEKVFEEIFPQLAESEDERIRMALCDIVRDMPYMETELRAHGLTAKKALAYLEKQKDLAAIPDELIKNYKFFCEEGCREAAALINAINGINEQKEQKPAEWSEEDKAILLSIKCVIDSVWHNFDYDCSKEELEEMWNWLDAMWKIVEYPQPKQEWSEEDEHRRTDAIYFLESAMKHYADTSEIEKTIGWLKSLRPQSKDEIYKEKDEAFKLGKHQLAIKFMNYLDENRPEGKIGLSNSECEDIDKAFKENNWAKIMRYMDKYRPSWKPSKAQMKALLNAEKYLNAGLQYGSAKRVAELIEQLTKLGVEEEPEHYQNFDTDC